MSSAGDDANAGTIEEPLATATKACELISNTGTINIRAGTYGENLIGIIPSGFSSDNPVTIQAYNGEEVIIQPTSGDFVVRISGVNAKYIVLKDLILDAANVTIDGLKITSGAHHVTLNNVTVKNCVNEPNATQGFLISDDAHDILLESCKAINNGFGQQSHGFYLSGVYNVTVRGGEASGNSGHGWHVYGGGDVADGYRIELDSLYAHDNADYGIGVYYGLVVVKNCISRRNRINYSARFAIKNALFVNNTGMEPLDTWANMDIVNLLKDNAVVTLKNNAFVGDIGVWLRGDNNNPTASLVMTNNLINADEGMSLLVDPNCNLSYGEDSTVSASFSPITDDGAENIKPTEGNPAIGAGVADENVTDDYGGSARSNPPTIGAWE